MDVREGHFGGNGSSNGQEMRVTAIVMFDQAVPMRHSGMHYTTFEYGVGKEAAKTPCIDILGILIRLGVGETVQIVPYNMSSQRQAFLRN